MSTLNEHVLRPLAAGTRRRPVPPLQRRLAAVMSLDVKGYSLLMGRDDADTHRRVGAGLTRAIDQIGRHEGRVFSFSGDGLMAEFPSAVKALLCALRIQAANARQHRRQHERRRIEFRFGVHAGDIVDQDGRAGGDAVNIAARLEQIAEAGTIFLSRDVFELTARVVHSDYAHIGERQLKNIE